FTLKATTNRTFITLHMMHTRKNYRRRGHGAVAFALLKEFACSNPFRPKCDTAFVWLAAPTLAKSFYLSPRVGCLDGWARLSEIVHEEEPQPTSRKFMKGHCMLTKYFKGGYIEAIMYGRAHPAYGGVETRERKIEHQSWAEYQVGTRIIVSYPSMKSAQWFPATVLNYNHLERKPYYIQYDTGNETEFVVIGRIKGLEGSVKPTVKSPKKAAEGGGG
ncbi:hypothetical protein TrRE_jg4082, partial [Triparma retinervis]